MQQFQVQVQLSIPQNGPRGGNRDPIVRNYGVCASTREEAIEIFKQEMTVPEGATVMAFSTRSRVIRAL